MTSIPLRFIPGEHGSGQIFPSKIGVTRCLGLWDTGAGLTTIDRKLIEREPDIFTRLETLRGSDTTSPISLDLYRARAVTVGEHTFPNILVLAADLSAVSAVLEEPLELVLGFNILVQKTWFFDAKNSLWAVC